jgi:hypothetical protein
MLRKRWLLGVLTIGLVFAPPTSWARPVGVDIWTDRGKDAVYEPGEPVEIKVRASDDGYLLVYDIDSEGYVRVLYPYEGSSGYIAGRQTYQMPPSRSGLQLVVQGPVGQGYIVALVSREPFNALPRYLRPYDPQAEGAGYVEEEENDEQDVTSDGRIVGDPFVAMERIRRQVLSAPNDPELFATAYTSYYIHQPVRYPRYLCNDCHRPNQWAWWDGFDPYYTSCPSFDFRVYWGWSWGPRYWFGTVPYFCYVPRCYPCAPYDRPYYSSWNGPRQWSGLWNGHLTRRKSAPPVGYSPPSRYDGSRWKESKPLPPGYLPGDYLRGGNGVTRRVPVGANRPGVQEPVWGKPSPGGSRPGPERGPRTIWAPPGRPGSDEGGRSDRPRDRGTAPGRTPPGSTPVAPGYGSPREGTRPSSPPPRYERPREGPRPSSPAPKPERPREETRAPSPPSSPPPHPAPERPGDSGRGSGGERRGRG